MTPTTQRTYSPGPWIVWADEGDCISVCSSPSDGIHGVCIASVKRSAEEITNARLIAAAPTMASYIERRAQAGDAEAIRILEDIDVNS